jgi:hypothetical protein
MHNYRLVFLVTVCTLLSVGYDLLAQQKTTTINKVINKELILLPDDELNVIGEKATIHISGWQKNFAQIKITFSSTHVDKEIATQELEFMQYAITREKHNVEVRNAFILPASTDYIRGKLEVSIEVMMPAANSLSLTNRYGNTSVSQLSGKVNTNVEFSDMDIRAVNGVVTLQSSYSEVHGYDMAVSSLHSQDEQSQISMDLKSGAYIFNSKHSDLDLTINNIQSLKVESSRTKVTIHLSRLESYNYRLTSKDGKISLPEPYAKGIRKQGKADSFTTTINPALPTVHVTTTFNRINIQ